MWREEWEQERTWCLDIRQGSTVTRRPSSWVNRPGEHVRDETRQCLGVRSYKEPGIFSYFWPLFIKSHGKLKPNLGLRNEQKKTTQNPNLSQDRNGLCWDFWSWGHADGMRQWIWKEWRCCEAEAGPWGLRGLGIAGVLFARGCVPVPSENGPPVWNDPFL